MVDSSEVAKTYHDKLVEVGYEIEWQEGSKRGKNATPKDIAELKKIVDQEAAANRPHGIFITFID